MNLHQLTNMLQYVTNKLESQSIEESNTPLQKGDDNAKTEFGGETHQQNSKTISNESAPKLLAEETTDDENEFRMHLNCTQSKTQYDHSCKRSRGRVRRLTGVLETSCGGDSSNNEIETQKRNNISNVYMDSACCIGTLMVLWILVKLKML
jgi:hypothetical protein